jgi:hypothetical protein
LSADHVHCRANGSGIGVAEFTGRDLLVKKALAIAAAIEERPEPFQFGSDLSDMTASLDEIIENDGELRIMRARRGSP